MPILTPLVSFLAGLFLMRVLQPAGRRLGLVSRPREDRWNRSAVPTVGGIGVFAAGALALILTGGEAASAHRGLLIGAALIFLLGLYDDLRELNPPVKLIAQIAVALGVVFSGYRTGFFQSELLNVLVTAAWLVGITNALNLLDNMDGLAGGISLVAAGFLSFFFWRSGADRELLVISSALFGGLLAFLVYNFPPAKVFMGDGGSLLFGFTLAALAIAKTPQASNVFAVLGVPALLFTLPILDTVFVTLTRLMRGQSPARGGRDHTSHRLVAFGLSERQTVLVMYGVALVSGAAGAFVESLDYMLSLVMIPVLLVGFALLAAYISRLRVVEKDGRTARPAEELTSSAEREEMGEKTRVIVFDAGDGAELLLRSLAETGGLQYHVVGFIDDDEVNHGRRIQDIAVLGGVSQALDLLHRVEADGILAVPGAAGRPGYAGLRAACAEAGVWIRELRIGFEEI